MSRIDSFRRITRQWRTRISWTRRCGGKKVPRKSLLKGGVDADAGWEPEFSLSEKGFSWERERSKNLEW